MNTFEEQFPSLQKIPTEFQFYSYSKEQIQECCLDKQKVREAIIKHTACKEWCITNEEYDCVHTIFKELRL